jgi:hypothetical protein
LITLVLIAGPAFFVPTMAAHTDQFTVATRGKGTYEITEACARIVTASRVGRNVAFVTSVFVTSVFVTSVFVTSVFFVAVVTFLATAVVGCSSAVVRCPSAIVALEHASRAE